MNRKAILSLGLGCTLTISQLPGAGARTEARSPNGWRVAEPARYENLSVFPVLGPEATETCGFVTLDEALASGEAVVTEQGNTILRRTRDDRMPVIRDFGPEVNRLVLVNHSPKPLLLLAGELIAGGKQDRVIAQDRIVPPGASPLPLDVFCVEQGRWSAGMQFAATKMIVHPSVREKAAVDQNQQQVWTAVRSGTMAGAAGSAPGSEARLSRRTLGSVALQAAPTGSYLKLYQAPEVSGSVESFAEQVERRFARATANLKGQHAVGVVVAYGGELAWADVFASPELFKRYWPKLLRSYVVEALARPVVTGQHEQASLDDAREFLQQLQGRQRDESEPGVYRWHEITDKHYAEIWLEALAPKALVLHWVKIHRTS